MRLRFVIDLFQAYGEHTCLVFKITFKILEDERKDTYQLSRSSEYRKLCIRYSSFT
jgi:hypothetical protein